MSFLELNSVPHLSASATSGDEWCGNTNAIANILFKSQCIAWSVYQIMSECLTSCLEWLYLPTDLQSVSSANRAWIRSSGMYLKRVGFLGHFRDTFNVLTSNGMWHINYNQFYVQSFFSLSASTGIEDLEPKVNSWQPRANGSKVVVTMPKCVVSTAVRPS